MSPLEPLAVCTARAVSLLRPVAIFYPQIYPQIVSGLAWTWMDVCVFILINNRFLAQNPIDLNELITPSTTSNSTNSLQQLSRGVVPTMYLKLGAISNVDPQVEMIRVITEIA